MKAHELPAAAANAKKLQDAAQRHMEVALRLAAAAGELHRRAAEFATRPELLDAQALAFDLAPTVNGTALLAEQLAVFDSSALLVAVTAIDDAIANLRAFTDRTS